MSASLFLFIFTRRVFIGSRERSDRLVYDAMERDLLEVLTAADAGGPARAFARKHRARPRVLKRLLVAYREALAGRALEPLRIIFEKHHPRPLSPRAPVALAGDAAPERPPLRRFLQARRRPSTWSSSSTTSPSSAWPRSTP